MSLFLQTGLGDLLQLSCASDGRKKSPELCLDLPMYELPLCHIFVRP